METVELAPRGTLWTWTIQGFPPKAPPYVGETDPARFEPFGVGYVELPGQLKVEARLTESDPSRAAASAWRWSSCSCRSASDADGNRDRDVRVRDPVTGASMTDVAIVGIGMHEFGRTDGVSGMDQGAVAVRRALADAGLRWEDMQFAVGRLGSRRLTPTRSCRKLGLTGLQFTNVSNGCATGGTALFTAANTIVAGTYDVGIALGFDKHERGAFRVEHRSRPASATGTAPAGWRSPRSSSA